MAVFGAKFLKICGVSKRVADKESVTEGDVRVVLGRFDRVVDKKFLDIAYVRHVLRTVWRKRVAQAVCARLTGYAGFQEGLFKNFLRGADIDMLTRVFAPEKAASPVRPLLCRTAISFCPKFMSVIFGVTARSPPWGVAKRARGRKSCGFASGGAGRSTAEHLFRRRPWEYAGLYLFSNPCS
jgi:hypothetical protein